MLLLNIYILFFLWKFYAMEANTSNLYSKALWQKKYTNHGVNTTDD